MAAAAVTQPSPAHATDDVSIVAIALAGLYTVASYVVKACAQACARAPTACATVVEKARCAWALAVATYRVSVLQRYMAAQDTMVYKVVCVDEEAGTDATVPVRSFDPARWEASTRASTGWHDAKSLRVDVRYLAHGKKYRLVLRPGDACVLPPAPERHRGGPKGVMAAELVGDEGVRVDVTRRVHKYEGPGKDFHGRMGLRVAALDMFPMDDPRELAHSFHTLRIIDAHARVLHVPVDCPDMAAAVAADSKSD